MQHFRELNYQGKILRGMIHNPDSGTAPYPAVIIFHGFTGNKVDSHRIHVHISRFLEKSGIVSIRYDFLGSGESDGEFDEMTLNSEIAQAHAIYQQVCKDPLCDISRITIIGHSMGGIVASSLAGDIAAEKSLPTPAGLILIAPAGNMIDAMNSMYEEQSDWVKPDGSMDLNGFMVSPLFRKDIIEQLEPNRFSKRLSAFTNPVLVVHGTADEAVPVDVGKAFSHYYGNAMQWRPIPDADHCFTRCFYERQLLNAIGTFMQTKI